MGDFQTFFIISFPILLFCCESENMTGSLRRSGYLSHPSQDVQEQFFHRGVKDDRILLESDSKIQASRGVLQVEAR